MNKITWHECNMVFYCTEIVFLLINMLENFINFQNYKIVKKKKFKVQILFKNFKISKISIFFLSSKCSQNLKIIVK